MSSEVTSSPENPDQASCPVTGLPVVRRPEWTDVRLDDNYWTTVEIIGGHILRSTPGGHATADGVVKLNRLHREAIAATMKPDAAHVHITDYSNFKGATFDARRAFADDLKVRGGLAGLVVHNAPPLFKLSLKLGKRILGLHLPVAIAIDYPEAIRQALKILEEEGIEGLPSLAPGISTARQPETGAMDLDGYHLSYRVIDGHIIHARATGFCGVVEMQRNLEFQTQLISSLDRNQGPPILVVDMQDLEGVTTAARRLYVASLRSRQRVDPVALYVCYGASQMMRNTINISRPFLPFRVRIARDETTALEIARSDTTTSPGALSRLRSLLFLDKGDRQPAEPAHIDHLLRLIANIDWERDGLVEADWKHAPDHPLAPVIDALELIKADVDELFRTRRKIEQALRESEERYRNILDSIVDGYYEINLRGQVMLCNDALLRIFRFPRSDVDDFDAIAMLAPEKRRKAMAVFMRVLETGEPAYSIDWEIGTRDGTTIHVESSISLITDADGQAVGFRGIVRDITERVRSAREKSDLEAQLQRSQRMEAIGTLAGGIAHNFNNLLMGIQGNISLLTREHRPDGPHAKRLATIEALVEGGSKLTSQLLGYARSGRVDFRVVDLNSLALETAETFSLTRREYRVHTDLSERSMPVEIDPSQVEQALLNLLINAADAMPRGGDIYLSSRLAHHTELDAPDYEIKEGTHAVLSIRDTGHGMDVDTLERCFQPFFTTKGMSGGTGLGLASAYGIIRAHGGQIEVESTVGEGSKFSLSFPTAARGPDPIGAGYGPPVEGEGTILVVEDDEAVLAAFSEMLTLLHYTPICAGSGEAAIDIFDRRKDDIDLVVLDLILSDLNGGEVFDRIRAIDPDASVLLASGYSLEGEAAGILERGCDDFIQKPFTIEQLSLKVESVLRRKKR